MTAEVYAVDLDWEIVEHLALPDSVLTFRAESFSPKLIEDDEVRKIYEWAMEHLREHGQAATASVIEHEFETVEFEEPLTAINDLIERLRERYLRNYTKDEVEEIAETAIKEPRRVPKLMIAKGRDLAHLTDRKGNQLGTGDIDRALAMYDLEAARGPQGSFGFEEIDEHFYSLRGVTVWLGSPGTCKSWMGVNQTLSNVDQGRMVDLYSLEQPVEETYFRLICMAADIPHWKYLRGSINNMDRKKLVETEEELRGLGIFRVLSPARGERDIDTLVTRSRDAGADNIIIDQLQYVEFKDDQALGEGDTKDYWRVLEKARSYSEDGPITIIHQFNRTTMFSDGMPDMRQAKGSAAIEEVAYVALGLWANRDMRDSNLVELGTLKARGFEHKAWEIGINLNRSCNFELIGEAIHDDD